MADLVKKTEAIRALRKCHGYLFDASDNDPKIKLESAVTAIMDLPPAEQWIPVEERRPKEYENAWVTDTRGVVAVCYMAHAAWWDSRTDSRCYYLDEVVAWMPYILPEPYQKVSPKKSQGR